MADQVNADRRDRSTVADLIKELQRLDPDAEIGLVAASGFVRPVVVIRANQWAFRGGFRNAARAYLVRPAQDIV